METKNWAEAQQDAVNGSMLVVNPDADGFDVYDPRDPSRVYRVTGDAENPSCTCTDFVWKHKRTGRPCSHIQAVFRHMDQDGELPGPGSNGQGEPRRPDGPPRRDSGYTASNQPALMTLKRSVSPDGRIDSLSLEFTLSMDDGMSADIETSALDLLDRQDTIVEAYLDRRRNGHGTDNGNGHGQESEPPATNGAVAAMLRDVGGMQTRFGWRYYINVEAGRSTYRLFGTRQQLTEQLSAIGQGNAQLAKGSTINVPCLVVLEKSKDGKYTNVVELLPQAGRQAGRR